MSETVKPNHPLAEIIARKLLGISGVPSIEQSKMVNRAAGAAVEFHESEIQRLTARVAELEEISNKLRHECVKFLAERSELTEELAAHRERRAPNTLERAGAQLQQFQTHR